MKMLRMLGRLVASAVTMLAAAFCGLVLLIAALIAGAGTAHAGGGISVTGFSLLEIAAHYYPLVSSVVGTAAIAAALTPNTFDNKIVAFARAVLDFVAANFLNAKNENKPR